VVEQFCDPPPTLCSEARGRERESSLSWYYSCFALSAAELHFLNSLEPNLQKIMGKDSKHRHRDSRDDSSRGSKRKEYDDLPPRSRHGSSKRPRSRSRDRAQRDDVQQQQQQQRRSRESHSGSSRGKSLTSRSRERDSSSGRHPREPGDASSGDYRPIDPSGRAASTVKEALPARKPGSTLYSLTADAAKKAAEPGGRKGSALLSLLPTSSSSTATAASRTSSTLMTTLAEHALKSKSTLLARSEQHSSAFLTQARRTGAAPLFATAMPAPEAKGSPRRGGRSRWADSDSEGSDSDDDDAVAAAAGTGGTTAGATDAAAATAEADVSKGDAGSVQTPPTPKGAGSTAFGNGSGTPGTPAVAGAVQRKLDDDGIADAASDDSDADATAAAAAGAAAAAAVAVRDSGEDDAEKVQNLASAIDELT
jgi:hypothetical protein